MLIGEDLNLHMAGLQQIFLEVNAASPKLFRASEEASRNAAASS